MLAKLPKTIQGVHITEQRRARRSAIETKYPSKNYIKKIKTFSNRGLKLKQQKKVLCGLFHKINFVFLSVFFIVCQANTSRNLLSGCRYFFPDV